MSNITARQLTTMTSIKKDIFYIKGIKWAYNLKIKNQNSFQL